eukprot:s7054_g7.t1
MGGKKRPSMGGSDAAPTRRKSLESTPEIPKAFVVNPWFNQAVAKFDELWDRFEELETMMKHIWPTPESQKAWALRLNDIFPPEPGVEYLSPDWGEHAVKKLRPYHWSWAKDSGNKGPVNREAYRNLLISIMVKGFCTDVTQPGIELPLITPPYDDDSAKDDKAVIFPTTIDEELRLRRLLDVADAYSVNEIKGWSRATAMHVALAMMDATGHMDAYLDYLKSNDKFSNFQTQSANFLHIPDDKDEVDVNRGSVELSTRRWRTSCSTSVLLHEIS